VAEGRGAGAKWRLHSRCGAPPSFPHRIAPTDSRSKRSGKGRKKEEGGDVDWVYPLLNRGAENAFRARGRGPTIVRGPLRTQARLQLVIWILEWESGSVSREEG
jgi:hypothetical protein